MHAKLQQLQYLPSGLCSDEEFLRRVHLDVIGQLPTVEETPAFLADGAPDKRTKLIDALLDAARARQVLGPQVGRSACG